VVATLIAVAALAKVNCRAGQPAGAALPTWTARGDEIAFTVPQDEAGLIALARPGAARATGRWLSYDSAPQILKASPVGELLASQKRTGAIDVIGFGRIGGGEELVHAEFGKQTELGDWSRDGRRLVFARDGHIHVLDVATGEIHYLVDGQHPTWSPDGLTIAYAVGDELREVGPDGGPARTIATADTQIATIAWSPDGTRLAFLGKVIGIVTRFGGKPLYTAPALPPLAWRPNGIFYSLEEVAPVRLEVWRFNPDTGTTTQVTHLPPPFDAAFVDASRDGSRIAYQLAARDGPAGVRVVDGDGRHDQPLLACHGPQ